MNERDIQRKNAEMWAREAEAMADKLRAEALRCVMKWDTREVGKYFKRIGQCAYEPHSCSRRGHEEGDGVQAEHLSVMEAWCPECQAIMEPGPELNATGIDHVCPWCGTRLY